MSHEYDDRRPSPAVQKCRICGYRYQLFDGDPPHVCYSDLNISLPIVERRRDYWHAWQYTFYVAHPTRPAAKIILLWDRCDQLWRNVHTGLILDVDAVVAVFRRAGKGRQYSYNVGPMIGVEIRKPDGTTYIPV